jgi:hypothetical protein
VKHGPANKGINIKKDPKLVADKLNESNTYTTYYTDDNGTKIFFMSKQFDQSKYTYFEKQPLPRN